MPVPDENEANFKRWSFLIKDDKINEVLAEVENNSRKITEGRALDCLVYISQLAYKDTQCGGSFSSPLDDIVKLTEILCSLVISRPNLCNLRFISSLYHIVFFFYKRNDLTCVKQIYNIILDTKQANISTFQGDGAKVYDNFVLLLKKIISKHALDEDLLLKQFGKKEFISIFLDLLVVEDEVMNGSTFLETVLHASQIVASRNKKSATLFICKCLQLFFKVRTIRDDDSSLKFVFKLFSSLLTYQLDVTGFASALNLVLSYVDTNKWKFGEKNILHGECFYLLCQAKMFTTSQSETTVRKMIQNVHMTLEKFKNIGNKKDFVTEACLFILYSVDSFKESKTIGSSVLLGACLDPFLRMMLKLYDTLTKFNVDKYYSVCGLSSCFTLILEKEPIKELYLKNSLETILKIENLLLELTQGIRAENHDRADYCTRLVVSACGSLVRSLYFASLHEEIIAASHPFCKFLCTLPPCTFDDARPKASLENAFTLLMQGLGTEKLAEVLEVAVAWLIVCPQSTDKIFRRWADVKHNAVCSGDIKYLDTSIYTIVTERKSSLEEKWISCNLTSAELGNLLVKELNTYFINSSLRGTPVLETTKALESLATDDLTQAKGVVVALDVTSARYEYSHLCHHYSNRSKELITSLRKQESAIDPVEFYCCIGELLFADFRLELKSFRSQCEGEVLRLSALHESVEPLVAVLPEEQPDPNDTCEVTPGYANLSLNKQKETLTKLHDAITHWKTACTYLTKKKKPDKSKYDLTVTLGNLQEAAFIMRLYCDETKEMEIWHLVHTLAIQTEDGDSVINAAGEMLKAKRLNLSAFSEAEDLLENPEVQEKTKHALSLNKALFHLNNNEIIKGLELLKAKIKNKERLNSFLAIHCYIILGLYQKLNYWESWREESRAEELFTPSCHLSFHKALTNLLYLIQQKKWCSLLEASKIQLCLLEVACQLGEVNWSLEQPREARCYLKSQLSVAQKLGLPLRSAQILLLLAWVDLYTGEMDDCAVKLEGLETLLNLRGPPTMYFDGSDCPKRLSKKEVWRPDFLNHAPNHDCFVCRCTEYQRLVLETITLRATYCANLNQLPLAIKTFKVAFQVKEYLRKSQDSKVHKSFFWLWKHYVDAMAMCNNPQYGLYEDEKALGSFDSIQSAPNLVQRISHQKSGLHSFKTSHNKPVKQRIVIEIEETTVSGKTPVTKQGKALPVLAQSPLTEVSGNSITPQFRRRVKKFLLPSSGEENTPPPKSSPRSKRRIKPPLFKLETPQSNRKLSKTAKTPFKVFDDGNGNAERESSSKIKSRVIKKTNDVVEPTSKKLFSSGKMPADKKSDVPFTFKSPERKSSRKPNARTAEKTGLMKGVSNSKKPESYHENSLESKEDLRSGVESFSFHEIKKEIRKIDSGIPKYYSKRSTKLVSNNACSKDSSKGVVPSVVAANIESDCSIVEGTPSPPRTRKVTVQNMKPRRATRSNKT